MEKIASELLVERLADWGVLDRAASEDAILTADSGTMATWAARHFDIRGDRRFYLSANLASMAPALPYAIAAQWAHPDRQCIAFVGDGGMAMLMAEFDTACRSRWSSATTPPWGRSCGSRWCSASPSTACASSRR
jgi:thiamine pyrophosphate-dependent acetolactate synthase large subunit-like protein